MKRADVDLLPQGPAHLRAAAELGHPTAGAARFEHDARFFASLRARADEAELSEEAALVAWELARAADGLATAQARAFALLVLATFVAQRDGSTYLPLEKPALSEHLKPLALSETELRHVHALVAELRGPERPAALAELVGDAGARTPLVVLGPRLHHERLWNAEERFVAAVRARRALASAWPRSADADDAAFADVFANPTRASGGAPIVLTTRQREAVALAASSPFTVISGGPGTGKTSVIVAILRALARRGVAMTAVALAAPTGKAAHRMRGSIEQSLLSLESPSEADRKVASAPPAATTLHRLLGYSPSRARFKHHENNRLTSRYVLVDEASMIDLFLMEKLLRALRDDASLVLLGDTDQLPSVDAGTVLRDLGERDAVRLVESHRMDPRDPSGRAILTVAGHLNAGRVKQFYKSAGQGDLFGGAEGIEARACAADLCFERVEMLQPATAEERAALWQTWWGARIAPLEERARVVVESFEPPRAGEESDAATTLRALLRHYEEARVLCVTKGAGKATGAEALNAVFHHLALEDAEARGGLRGAPPLFPGEPVLLVENDYERGLFNGDQGVVARLTGEQLVVVFARGEELAVFPLEALRPRLRLSYATTVHKSQGSEMSYVALVLPEEDHPLVTRELLYTAVTRSRKSVVVVGKKEVLEAGALRPVRRSSGIGEKLAKE